MIYHIAARYSSLALLATPSLGPCVPASVLQQAKQSRARRVHPLAAAAFVTRRVHPLNAAAVTRRADPPNAAAAALAPSRRVHPLGLLPQHMQQLAGSTR